MEMDAAYASLFGTEGRAAVLGCDELGLVPRDLLHRPKKSFKQVGDDKCTVLVRYTLTERARQNNIRKVLAIKNCLIAEGNVQQKWRERCKLFPDAPGVPKIPKAVIKKALAELDTETEGDDNIDELGLVKPLSQYGSAQEAATPQLSTPIANGSDGKTNTSSLVLETVQLTPRRAPGTDTPAQSNSFASAPKRGGSAHRLCSPIFRKFRAKHSTKMGSRDNVSPCGKSSRSVSRKSSRGPLLRHPRPPPDPPFLPPVPYSHRDTATLQVELEELDEYRRFLLRYAHDSFSMAKEYNEFTTSLRKASETKKVTQGAAVGSAEFSSGKGTNGANAVGRGEAEGLAKSTPATGAATAHNRQLAAYVRLAKLEVQRNKSNYKKWNGFMEEMEGVQPVGTIAAELRARSNVGVFPAFENYVQLVKERAQRREKALSQYTKQQQKLKGSIESKDRHTTENIVQIKKARKNIFMEAQQVQGEIKRRNREHETRRRRMREHRVQVGLSKKEMLATDSHMKRLLRAKEKRFEHDAEEIFRRTLKGKIHEMDQAKRWDMKLVRIQ
ncbi:hypothetical protein TraAM80_00840 [Trypanosoma rangeli]|uniref:Uncharacterized protein n=1 Tax=Trypanosoma rangeli TaxID=5698 RepID=A0A422P196_TRYRA|nr:uncharacterized protein TraAM80_00840 [Trypanosoma rangeli]RNF11513.1 hypothetical protein TraAM80_00840 [Trypanosoma rangeli]|eukprot:RNF11513.1 hypothetical protein TraAM80_00840 [Trypanosoma rangeli]